MLTIFLRTFKKSVFVYDSGAVGPIASPTGRAFYNHYHPSVCRDCRKKWRKINYVDGKRKEKL
jgi:hypothetical protein